MTRLTPPPPGGTPEPSHDPEQSYDTAEAPVRLVSPDLDDDVWGPTHLAAPPAGSATTGQPAWPDPGPGWMPDAAPDRPSAFSPPEERGAIPAAETPVQITTLVVPKPVRGLPADQPEAGRFAAPPEPVVRTSRRPKPLLLALGIALVVLTGFAAYGAWDAGRPVSVPTDIIVPSSAQASAPKVARGDLAVKGYLTALAAGDIDAALSYGPVGGGSRALLVPGALKASLAAAPITNINVTPADATASTIHASYQLGTQAVVSDFKVVKRDDGNWQLASSTTTVRLSAARSDRVPLIVNGEKVGPVVELELVPGTYTMTTGLPYLAYQSTTRLTVPDLAYAKPIADLPVEVTPEGRTALVQAAQASLAACLDYQQLSPPNCPMNEHSPRPVIPSTIKRELVVADPVSGAQWVVDAADAAEVSALIPVHYRFSAAFDANTTTSGTDYNQSWTARVDATKPTLTVEWGH
ncbi:MAG TPA: hypothetical protein VFK68_11500 [Propionibacteriaceae bacterium]|nr:hypothetical protein [Propionibacteriaceae bacterium]